MKNKILIFCILLSLCSDGFAIRRAGIGDLKSPFQNGRITNPSELNDTICLSVQNCIDMALENNIELKNSCVANPGMEEQVIELAAKEFDLSRVIFSSFSHARRPISELLGYHYILTTSQNKKIRANYIVSIYRVR